jgi:HPt (histidine-containing phosphotransfer) domain-containing protein
MRVVDLTFLNKFTKGDKVKTNRYISMFLKYSDELLEKMQEAIKIGDGDNLAIHAHSLKPQAEMIGVLGMKEKLILIEDLARSYNLKDIPSLLDQVLELNRKAEAELNDYLELNS